MVEYVLAKVSGSLLYLFADICFAFNCEHLKLFLGLSTGSALVGASLIQTRSIC